MTLEITLHFFPMAAEYLGKLGLRVHTAPSHLAAAALPCTPVPCCLFPPLPHFLALSHLARQQGARNFLLVAYTDGAWWSAPSACWQSGRLCQRLHLVICWLSCSGPKLFLLTPPIPLVLSFGFSLWQWPRGICHQEAEGSRLG